MRRLLKELPIRERHALARERIFSGQAASQLGVDPAVMRGWQRCLAMGLRADRPVVFRTVRSSETLASMESARQLVQAAESELDQLARALVPSGASIILADADLIAVAVRGRPVSMERELQGITRVGVDLGEAGIGSNALTIAAVENRPILVLENGHFCDANAVFSCAAAPIRCPNGKLLGVIDVTTCRQALAPDGLFLVTVAAKAIENAVFERSTRHVMVCFHSRHDFVGTALEARILCSVDGFLVGANEAALKLLGLSWPLAAVRFDRCFRLPFEELLAEAGRLEHFSIGLTTVPGHAVHARVWMPLRERVASLRLSPEGDDPTGRPGAPGLALSLSTPSPSVSSILAPSIPAAEQPLIAQARAALKARVPVVLAGEPGVGKRTLALRLAREAAAGRPVVSLECSALDASGVAAAMACVDAGALLLHDVQDLRDSAQLALRAHLNTQPGTRPSAAGTLRCRLISTCCVPFRVPSSAAWQPGPAEGLEGVFGTGLRPELWQRLKGLLLRLPALRDRPDRERLVEQALAARLGADRSFEAAAMARLRQWRWPGNLRELNWVAAFLEAVARPGQPIGLADLPEEIGGPAQRGPAQRGPAERGPAERGPASRGSLGVSAELVPASSRPAIEAWIPAPGGAQGPSQASGHLREIEARAIEEAIARHRGNLSQAARELGVSRGTLYRRIRQSPSQA